jgi:hypothetical protein
VEAFVDVSGDGRNDASKWENRAMESGVRLAHGVLSK